MCHVMYYVDPHLIHQSFRNFPIFNDALTTNIFTLFLTYALSICSVFFFFNDPAPTEIYPLPLHDALPISESARLSRACLVVIYYGRPRPCPRPMPRPKPTRSPRASRSPRSSRPSRPNPSSRLTRSSRPNRDRKSTRLNSSHDQISYAVFCL